MNAADVFKAIELGEHIASAIASAFGLDEQAVIKVAREKVRALMPSPPDQSKAYFDARKKLEGDADERSEMDRGRSVQVGGLGIHVHRNDDARDTDRAPPPKPSER